MSPNNLYQAPRYGIDEWDKMMMERDQRLTGSMRGQSVCFVYAVQSMMYL